MRQRRSELKSGIPRCSSANNLRSRESHAQDPPPHGASGVEADPRLTARQASCDCPTVRRCQTATRAVWSPLFCRAAMMSLHEFRGDDHLAVISKAALGDFRMRGLLRPITVGSGLDQTVANGIADQAGKVAYIQSCHDLSAIGFDGLDAER